MTNFVKYYSISEKCGIQSKDPIGGGKLFPEKEELLLLEFPRLIIRKK